MDNEGPTPLDAENVDNFFAELNNAQKVVHTTIKFMMKRAKKQDAMIPMVILSLYLVARKNHKAVLDGQIGNMTREQATQMYQLMEQYFETQLEDAQGRPVAKH